MYVYLCGSDTAFSTKTKNSDASLLLLSILIFTGNFCVKIIKCKKCHLRRVSLSFTKLWKSGAEMTRCMQCSSSVLWLLLKILIPSALSLETQSFDINLMQLFSNIYISNACTDNDFSWCKQQF